MPKKYFLFFLCMLLTVATLKAQQPNIIVQVNVLPPYQQSILDYQSRPNQVVIILTNPYRSTYDLQLRAMLKGDNGVVIRTKPDYWSPRPISLDPLQTIRLTAENITELFHLNSLEFTNVHSSDIIRNGTLPEGNYQLCIELYEYNQRASLGSEVCSNSFPVQSLEPPVIIKPIADEMVNVATPQNIVFSWTTPPSAPPSTEYVFKIVEVIGDRNPNDAIRSNTGINSMEEVVRTNALLYGPGFPALIEGRKYAIQVTARDPFQKAIFRNSGKSEVVMFTYGNSGAIVTNDDKSNGRDNRKNQPPQYATHTIKGTLQWAFKRSEEAFSSPATFTTTGNTNTPVGNVNIKPTGNTIASFALQPNSPVNIYTGHNQVQASRPTTLGQIDPTLSFKLPVGTTITGTPKAADVVSSAGATSLEYARETITVDTGQQKYPLANTMVLVQAESAYTQRTVLGTSRTDEKGNFSLPFINPAYEGITTCKYIVVTISSGDFETKEFRFPVSDLSNSNEINLGIQTVLAKTYRLTPTITIEKAEGASVESPRVVVRLYREAADIDNNGYLKEEGNLPAAARKAITIQGKKMILVAVDSVQQLGLVSISGASLKFGFGKLFYKGRLYIEMESPSGQFTQRQADLGVTDQQLPANQVVVVKPSYEIKLKFPAVQGQVMMYAGSSIVPVPGAILQVEYNEGDVVAKNPNLITSLQVTSVPVSSLNTQAGKITVSSSREGVISNTANAAPIHPVTMAAAAAPINIAAPIMISTAPISTNSSSASAFKYMPVMQPADESRSHTQLIDKGGAYTVKTDSSGQFYIGNLPLLKAGANFTLKLVSVPQQYKDMEVAPAEKSFQLAIAKGGVAFREFSIKPEVISIVGRAVNAQKIALPNARLHFKGSSSYFESGETGLFQTTYFAGKHTLIIEKEGYVAKEESFEIVAGAKNKGKNEPAVPANAIKMDQTVAFTNSLQASSTVQKALQQGQTFNAALFGNATAIASGSTPTAAPQAAGFASMLTTSVHNNSYAFILPNTQDLGDVGFLLKKTGKVKFRVVDKDNNTTAIAGAVIQLFDSSYTTNASGTWQYEGFGGNATVTVTAPAGYVSLRTSVIIQENGVENEVILKLEKGVKVYGNISSGSQSVPGARIQAEGFDYLQSITDASGNYELYLPSGEQILKAAKSGYLSKTEKRTLQKGTPLLLNFNLSNGGGRNISSLLGFEIELDQATPEGSGEKWSGRFVNLKPVSDVFAVPENISIAFSNIKVNFDGEGNALPQGNEIQTDAVNIPVKLFKFLPVSLAGSPVIKITKAADGKGSITGRLQVDVSQIQGSRGFAFNKAAPLFVVPASSTGVSDVELFHAGASGNMAAATMRLAQPGGSSASMDLYGFSVLLDLPKTSLNSEGLTLAGTISTPALGPVAPIKVGIETLTISKELRIQTVKLNTDGLPSMSIASWKASLNSMLLSESGFKLGGNITIALPASGTSSINFSNLSLSKEAIYGGQFGFPSDGLNLLNIVKLAGGSNPLSFGRVGNTSVYCLSGSAAIRFDKLITQEIKIPLFQIQTDGRFLVQAPVNFNADMGFAKFNLQNLIVSTTSGQAPYIGLMGEFKSDLSVLKFNVADIRFKAKAGGGTEFSVGTIGATLDIPVMKAALQVSLQDNGFSGAGSLGIPSTPINADIGFHYYKVPGGIDVGASFKSGIVIPIGLVTIENVGGGFAYNTAAKSFMININGAASITGTGTAIRLNPIGLTVESGPVIKGYAGIEVASVFTIAKAQMELNIPAKNFVVTIASELSPMPGLASSRVDGLLRISWDQQDPYVFLGCGMQTKMLGILDGYGEYALGFNIKNPRTRQDDISYFFRHLDDDLAAGSGTVFSGIYIHTGLKVGDRNKKYGFDITVASAKFWYESNSEVLLFMNVTNSQYKFKLKGGMSAGAELCAVGICVGAGFDACYGFTGGRDAVRGWYVGGEAAGSFQAYLGGCDAGCNSVDFCWPWEGGAGARVCANAYASINISQKDGISLSAGAGGNPNFNGCNY